MAGSRLRITPGTGKWWALGIAFTVLFTIFASWRVLSVADEQIDATTTGYKVVDERTMTVTFDIHKPPQVAVLCTIQAQDLKKNVVGAAQVDIPTAPTRTTSHQVTIKTTTLAFSGLVHDCIRR
ncbi:MAG: DUF4307 domain-containing protein [Actinomycetales bacterium]|nr:DUF4307 domain-containing protein [Actinomycetales bacterium]